MSGGEPSRPRRTARSRKKHEVVAFEDLLAGAQQDSPAAFEELFSQLSGRLVGYARSRRATDAEGLANDVLLRVFRNIGAFSGNEAQFHAWVFTIARNQLIDQGRKQQRRPTEAFDTPDRDDPAPENVEDEVLVKLDTEHLLAQLDVLTPEQREVVLLRIVCDLTIDAIAGILRKEPGAVKALQRRAFRRLATHLSSGQAYPYE